MVRVSPRRWIPGIVIAAILPRYTWESPEGVPIQLTAQAMKSELLAMKTGGGLAPAKAAPTKVDAKSTRIPTGGSVKSTPTTTPTVTGDAIKFSEVN